MTPGPIVSIAVVFTVVVGACGGAGTFDSANESGSVTSLEPSPELFSPTETTRTWDLSGGVDRNSDGVAMAVGNPKAGLAEDVSYATSPWPTDWSRRTVDLGEFLLGTELPRHDQLVMRIPDSRDLIPPIDVPKFESITAATWLGEREPGVLVQFNESVRFYPLAILTRHELINDRFGDVPVVITFCPLCNSAVAFDARVGGESLRFGVSGLIRKSDLVMWDDRTSSLWQQITGEAIVGELAGTKLAVIPTSIVSYGDVLGSFPDAASLSRETGFSIAYGANPYRGYTSRSLPPFVSGKIDARFPALSRVVGVNLDGISKAYPFSLVSEMRSINDELGGFPIVVLWGGDTADALDADTVGAGQAIGTGIAFTRQIGTEVLSFTSVGDDLFRDAETRSTWTLLGQAIDGVLTGEQLEVIPHGNELWFAWSSFFPDTLVFGS